MAAPCLDETTSQFHNTAKDTHARGHTGSHMGPGRWHGRVGQGQVPLLVTRKGRRV